MEFTSKVLAAPTAIAMQKNTPKCSPDSTDPQMNTRIWLDVGHAYEPRRWASGRAVAPDWRMWVRGVAGADISAFVEKVVFQLRPDTQFPFPKRVFLEPPYQLQKGGAAPAEVQIDVYLKFTTKPERVQLKYGPLIKNGAQSSADSQCIYYDVRNPSERLRMALMKSKPSTPHSGSVLVVLPNDDEKQTQAPQRTTKRKRCEFVEPIESIGTKTPNMINKRRKRSNKCPTCEQSRHDIKNLIRLAPMPELTDNELEHVSHMYLAHMKYENSRDPLPLPPMSDPIYDMPALPPSLRRARALAGVEIDYALQ